MLQEYVRSETHQGITTIEFFHPQSNSLPAKILHDLSVGIKHAGQYPGTNVIILRSAGEKAFCAGASFDELIAIKNEKEGVEFFSGFAHVINAMRLCPKFIIGRIHGKCAGGGVGGVHGWCSVAEPRPSRLPPPKAPIERVVGAAAWSFVRVR